MSSLSSQLIKPAIRNLTAYTIPDNRYPVKLDAMENPYSMPAKLHQRWLELLAEVSINRYPAPMPSSLTDNLVRGMGIPEGQAIMYGNGSDELIQIIMLALAKPGASMLTVEPGFSMYKLIAAATGIEYHALELLEDFSLPEDVLLAKIIAEQPTLLMIASPNNPTGNSVPRAILEAAIQASSGLVVIDEAYFSFADEHALDLLVKYPDKLLIMRTVSKLGAAGLRFGLLIGAPDWIHELNKIRLPYNINSLTQVSMTLVAEHYAVFDKQSQQICDSRAVLYQQLDTLDGVRVFPSATNFLLFRLERGNATEVFLRLKEQGILIKNLHGSHRLLDNCLRVSVGAEEENQRFLEVLTGLV
jgi:histidinol-phosphate aminotransferase